MKNETKRFPVFHVPHDGALFPEELMVSVCVSKDQFMRYHEQMRDISALEMVPPAWRNQEHTLYFPVSRLLCDVERFLGPEEPMERHGMGFCYERAFDGRQIKTVTEEVKQKTLRYYQQHHDLLDQICGRHVRVLLLDLHSFSDEIVPHDQLRQGESTPDVCLGIDDKYTPPELSFAVECVLHESGFSTARNYPYSGCLVPNALLNGTSRCDCVSIMLEWNKRFYCDEHSTPGKERLDQIRKTIARIVSVCEDLV